MDPVAALHYVVTAAVLLGSPGPGIVSLLAVGRLEGAGRGLRYYGGMQIGLAIGAAIAGLGLVSALQLVPWLFALLTFAAIVYLAYLGWQIAVAPVGEAIAPVRSESSFTARAGFMLGFANPKALLAFASLFASTTLFAGNTTIDIASKWILCVIVMMVVDLAWLMAGAVMARAAMRPLVERSFNIACGVTLIVAAMALVPTR